MLDGPGEHPDLEKWVIREIEAATTTMLAATQLEVNATGVHIWFPGTAYHLDFPWKDLVSKSKATKIMEQLQ